MMASTAFKLAICRLCISFLFAASIGKNYVGPLRPKAWTSAITGVLPSLAGGKIGQIRDMYCGGRFKGRSVSPVLAGATTSSSLKLRRASRARSLPNPCRLSDVEHVFSLTRKSMVFAFCCDTLRSFSLWASFFHWIYLAYKQVYVFYLYIRCTLHTCLSD